MKVENRIARCSYCKEPAQSSSNLAFFEYQGPGSSRAELTCKECGYHQDVHQEINPSTGRPGITTHKFEKAGDPGFDKYYCGCWGWD